MLSNSVHIYVGHAEIWQLVIASPANNWQKNFRKFQSHLCWHNLEKQTITPCSLSTEKDIKLIQAHLVSMPVLISYRQRKEKLCRLQIRTITMKLVHRDSGGKERSHLIITQKVGVATADRSCKKYPLVACDEILFHAEHKLNKCTCHIHKWKGHQIKKIFLRIPVWELVHEQLEQITDIRQWYEKHIWSECWECFLRAPYKRKIPLRIREMKESDQNYTKPPASRIKKEEDMPRRNFWAEKRDSK
jgi:hypothetical protein